jgi:hypothetical protein
LLSDARLDLIRAVAAAAGLLVLTWDWWRCRGGRAAKPGAVRDGLLMGLGLFSALCWWNLLAFHFGNYIHVWDVYHYYVGAKYFPELGYQRLYICTALADTEAGVLDLSRRPRIRDLENNRLVLASAALEEHGAACTAHFTPARWQEFKRDVAWFRTRMSPQRWRAAQMDHGYNASPGWGIAGSLLARTGPASNTQILPLTLIDPLLLVVMWVLVAWAFGWEVMCVGLIFWGTSYPSKFYWGGGGFLRQDWLFLSVAALCFLRRGFPGLGGFSLGAATLLRVFPAFLFLGLGLRVMARAFRERQFVLSSEERRVLAGATLAFVLLVPAATFVAGRWDAWASFLHNATKHASTPLTNYMGLKTVVAYDHDSRAELSAPLGLEEDPFSAWKITRARTFAERRYVFLALVLLFLGLLAAAVDRRPAWVAATLGIGLVATLGEITCYYYSIFLAYAFLWPERRLVGIGMCALASITAVIGLVTTWADVRYTLISLGFVIFVALCTAAFARVRECSHDPAPSST